MPPCQKCLGHTIRTASRNSTIHLHQQFHKDATKDKTKTAGTPRIPCCLRLLISTSQCSLTGGAAEDIGIVLLLHQGGAAGGAAAGRLELCFAAAAEPWQGLHHLWDHISRPAHNHPVI